MHKCKFLLNISQKKYAIQSANNSHVMSKTQNHSLLSYITIIEIVSAALEIVQKLGVHITFLSVASIIPEN